MANNYKNAVDQIQAPEDLKQRTAQMMKQPFEAPSHKLPIWKAAACLAMAAVITVGVLVIPRILKPVRAVAPAAQSSLVSPNDLSMVNGLYHDDKIQNILVLGVGKYNDSDNFYTNTMFLVSVDKRHNKLKVTSIDGGVYADVPGYQKSRLSLVYSLGKAPLTVKTVENSFGIAIDNYVTMGSSACAKTIDCFGSATVKVSDWQAEQINKYSGEEISKRLTAGTVKLTGKQLLYYYQLRELDDRVKPEPDIISTLIENKLKSSNVDEMNILLKIVYSLVDTDINQDSLPELGNSLVGINYPTINNKVPADNTYQEREMPMSGSTKSQLVRFTDFIKNKQLLAKFIYEDEVTLLTESSNAKSTVSEAPSNSTN